MRFGRERPSYQAEALAAIFGDLAVLPGTHHVGTSTRVEWVVSMVNEFLDAPMPDKAVMVG